MLSLYCVTNTSLSLRLSKSSCPCSTELKILNMVNNLELFTSSFFQFVNYCKIKFGEMALFELAIDLHRPGATLAPVAVLCVCNKTSLLNLNTFIIF